MGYKYACICEGICPSCTRYEPEQYYGHAEDVLAQSKGFSSYEEWRQHEQEEYYNQPND